MRILSAISRSKSIRNFLSPRRAKKAHSDVSLLESCAEQEADTNAPSFVDPFLSTSQTASQTASEDSHEGSWLESSIKNDKSDTPTVKTPEKRQEIEWTPSSVSQSPAPVEVQQPPDNVTTPFGRMSSGSPRRKAAKSRKVVDQEEADDNVAVSASLASRRTPRTSNKQVLARQRYRASSRCLNASNTGEDCLQSPIQTSKHGPENVPCIPPTPSQQASNVPSNTLQAQQRHSVSPRRPVVSPPRRGKQNTHSESFMTPPACNKATSATCHSAPTARTRPGLDRTLSTNFLQSTHEARQPAPFHSPATAKYSSKRKKGISLGDMLDSYDKIIDSVHSMETTSHADTTSCGTSTASFFNEENSVQPNKKPAPSSILSLPEGDDDKIDSPPNTNLPLNLPFHSPRKPIGAPKEAIDRRQLSRHASTTALLTKSGRSSLTDKKSGRPKLSRQGSLMAADLCDFVTQYDQIYETILESGESKSGW